MTNLYCDGKVVYFSKQDYPDRYVVALDTLNAAKLYSNGNNNEWKHDKLMTFYANWSAGGFSNTINRFTQANQKNNQADRNADIMDDMTGRVGGFMATQGLINFLSGH